MNGIQTGLTLSVKSIQIAQCLKTLRGDMTVISLCDGKYRPIALYDVVRRDIPEMNTSSEVALGVRERTSYLPSRR